MEGSEAAITNLRIELAQQKTIAHALALSHEPGTGGSTGKGPELFSGNFKDLRSFVMKLRLKTSNWTDEQTKLKYAVNLLSDKALDQVAHLVTPNGVTLNTLEEVIDILTLAFDNPNRVADAEHKLRTLRQGTKSFSDYFAEFQRYASEVSWNDDAKLSTLRGGLSQQML